MIRLICDVKVTDRFMYNELRERLGIDDIITVLQWNKWWWGHVWRKDQNDWLKKCMDYGG